jgi:hypothetical protein
MKKYCLSILLFYCLFSLKEGIAQEKPLAPTDSTVEDICCSFTLVSPDSDSVEDIERSFTLVSGETIKGNAEESDNFVSCLSQLLGLENSILNVIIKEKKGLYKGDEKGKELEKILIQEEGVREYFQVLKESEKVHKKYKEKINQMRSMGEYLRQECIKMLNRNLIDKDNIPLVLDKIEQNRIFILNEYAEILKKIPQSTGVYNNEITSLLNKINQIIEDIRKRYLEILQGPPKDPQEYKNAINESLDHHFREKLSKMEQEYSKVVESISDPFEKHREEIGNFLLCNINIVWNLIPYNRKIFYPCPDKRRLRKQLNQLKLNDKDPKRIFHVLKSAKEIVSKYENEILALKEAEEQKISLLDIRMKKENDIVKRTAQFETIKGFLREIKQIQCSPYYKYTYSYSNIYKAIEEDYRRLKKECEFLSDNVTLLFSIQNPKDKMKFLENMRKFAEDGSTIYMPESVRRSYFAAEEDWIIKISGSFGSEVTVDLNGIRNLLIDKKKKRAIRGGISTEQIFQGRGESLKKRYKYYKEKRNMKEYQYSGKMEGVLERLDENWRELGETYEILKNHPESRGFVPVEYLKNIEILEPQIYNIFFSSYVDKKIKEMEENNITERPRYCYFFSAHLQNKEDIRKIRLLELSEPKAQEWAREFSVLLEKVRPLVKKLKKRDLRDLEEEKKKVAQLLDTDKKNLKNLKNIIKRSKELEIKYYRSLDYYFLETEENIKRNEKYLEFLRDDQIPHKIVEKEGKKYLNPDILENFFKEMEENSSIYMLRYPAQYLRPFKTVTQVIEKGREIIDIYKILEK